MYHFCLISYSKLISTQNIIKSKANAWTINPAQISPNLRFCFKKRVHHRTLLKGLWQRVILDLNLSNWELYGASWWIIWFSFHFVIYGWSSPWAGRVPQLTRLTTAWTSRPLQDCRPWGPGGAIAHPDFVRSVNPISTREEWLCPPNYYWHTQIFRPSDGPAISD